MENKEARFVKSSLLRFFQGKDKKHTALRIGAVALLVLIIGASLAYFTSRDTVTNQVSAEAAEISLLEPNWWSTGITAAENTEPGMTIAKDPQVYNKSEEASVYVRMKITVTDEDGNEITDDDAAGAKRLYAILSALYLNDGTTQLLSIVYDEGENEITSLTSENSSFYYSGGWFYYVEAATITGIALEILAPGDTTPTLFSYVVIPVLKTEYDGYFDAAFHIDIEAQAFPVDSVNDGEDASLSEVINAFADAYGY